MSKHGADYNEMKHREARMAPYRARKTKNLLRKLYVFTHTPAFLILVFISIVVAYYSLWT